MTTNNDIQRQYSRRQGLLIVAIIVLPMVIAYIMFKPGWGMPTDTINKGMLLAPPQPVSKLELVADDKTLQGLYPAEKKQWRIMVPVSASCKATCQKNLFITRQVHIRLAEKAPRVERILLALEGIPERKKQQLLAEHPNVLWLNSSRSAFANWLADTHVSAMQLDQHYFLIDQDGFAMMSYNPEHTGQDLLDDLKKLLKYTYEQ